MAERETPKDPLPSLLDAAAQAPSSHNTQPWRFVVGASHIDVRADRARGLPVNDPADRELTISCGAAVFNIEVAANAAGIAPLVTVQPEPDDADLLARVRLEEANGLAWPGSRGATAGRRITTESYADLARAIDRRHTVRTTFSDRPIPDDVLASLDAAARSHLVGLHLDVDRERLADLVAAGDRRQFADPAWRRELAMWMHPQRAGDGLVVPTAAGTVVRAMLRTADLGRSTGRRDARLVREAPVVAVLATQWDDVPNWVEAGRALEHVLLVAAEHGLSAGFVNQPCQVPELRVALRVLLPDEAIPQVVFRLGVAEPTRAASPRRPLDDVLDDADG